MKLDMTDKAVLICALDSRIEMLSSLQKETDIPEEEDYCHAEIQRCESLINRIRGSE